MFDKVFWIWLYWQRVPIRDPQLSANMVMGGTSMSRKEPLSTNVKHIL